MNRLRKTLALCCVAVFASIAAAQPFGGGGGNQAALDQLGGAADEAALIGIHQELDIPRGDTDGSGQVQFVDFLILSNDYGKTGTSYAEGDLNLDGETSLADFSLLSQNFGKEGYQPEPSSRPPNANLGLWLNDGDLIVSSATVQQIGGFEIRSPNESLVPGSDFSSAPPADPFTFYLSRSSSNLTVGRLATAAEIDGDYHTDFGTTDSSSLTISWFEPGSYDLYSLGFGEGDALTNRRLNDPPPPPTNEPEPPPFGGPPAEQDERFSQVADLSELTALHQEADVPRGDFEANGTAGFSDFLILSNNYKQEVDSYSEGDANLDGIVDLKDFAIHSNNFGQSGYSPDPPPTDRVQLTPSINANQKVVITPEDAVDLGGLVIESSNGGLADITFDVKAEPLTFFLERTNESVTLGSLGIFVSVDEPFTTNVVASADSELSLQWFQRGSYEVFSTSDEFAALTLEPSLVGDLDNDGRVGFPDFLILSRNYGQPVTPNESGDIDGDGNVGFPDFLLLSNNFGTPAAGEVSPVPEPSAKCMLAALGSIALMARKRRRG